MLFLRFSQKGESNSALLFEKISKTALRCIVFCVFLILKTRVFCTLLKSVQKFAAFESSHTAARYCSGAVADTPHSQVLQRCCSTNLLQAGFKSCRF